MSAGEAAEWWAQYSKAGSRPSFLQLISNRTVDLRGAALLWLLVERRASIIVAAGPDLAGKTSLLTALVDLVPPWYEQVYLNGRDEDFSFMKNEDADPGNTYVLVPEFSDEAPAYIWGKPVLTLFRALGKGYSVLSTMHADSPEEVIASLQKDLKIPRSLVNEIHVVANVRRYHVTRSPSYRVSQFALLDEGSEAGKGRIVTLAGWDPDTDSYFHMKSQATVGALAARVGMDVEELDEDVVRRSWTLRGWLDSRSISVGALRRIIASYYDNLQHV